MMDAGLAIEVAVKGVLVLTAACTLYVLMRRYAASQRHLVLAVAMVGMLLIPAFAILLPNVTVPIRATAIEPDPSVTPVTTSTSVISPPPAIEPVTEVRRVTEEPGAIAAAAEEFVTSSSATSTLSWPSALAVVWAAGFLVSLFPLMIGLLGIRAVRKSGRALIDPEWTGALRAARVGLGVTTSVTLIESPRARVPMTWGVFRCYIAFPESARDWSPQRRQVVLCHELAHIKRRDFLTQLIARVACAAHWFNPLSWWTLRAMSLERERACDDLVVQSGVRAPDYAEHLLQIVRDMRGASFTARTAIAMAGHSRLEQRVRALLDATQNRRTLSAGARILTAGAALACVAFVAMLQPTAVAEEADHDGDTKIVIRNSDARGDRDVRVIRTERKHRHESRNERSRNHEHDLGEILEHVSGVLEDLDLGAIIENALGSLENDDVQGHIERALKHVENVDINAEIEQALEETESIELSEEDIEEFRNIDRHEIRREIRKARRELRNANIDEHIEEALRHIEDIDIDAHISEALEHLQLLQNSPEWAESVEAIQGAIADIDFDAISEIVGQKLEEIDVEPIMEAALTKVDEIDVDAIVNTLNERLEEIDVVVDSHASRFDQTASRGDIETLLKRDNLRRANLHQAKLRGMDLSGKDLRGAWLAGADLREANLEDADLRDADLSGANLREANLRNAKLDGARLDNANLRDTDLTGVHLRGVNLTNTDTRGAQKSPFVPSR